MHHIFFNNKAEALSPFLLRKILGEDLRWSLFRLFFHDAMKFLRSNADCLLSLFWPPNTFDASYSARSSNLRPREVVEPE
jgi:hypothetical protein